MLFKTPHIRRQALILLKASVMANLALGLFAPIYAVFVQQIGGGILDIGIALALFYVVTGLFVIFFGTSKFFAKHVRTMVVIGYALLTLGFIGYIFIKIPIHLFIVQIVLGIADGILEPSWDSVYSAKLSEKQESKQWSIWAGSIHIVLGVAAIAGGLIVTHGSFKILFVIMAVLGAISAVIASQLLKNYPKQDWNTKSLIVKRIGRQKT